MGRALSIGSGIAVLAMACCGAMAQATYEEENDNPRGNVHLGTPIVIPLNPTAQAVHLGFGFTVGGGYNFTRRHAVIGELMWNNLFPTNEALAKLRTALDNPSVDAGANVTALTGNYRYELRGKLLGAYLIGGAGLYYRHTSLSQTVTTTSTITCTPTLEWWGFTCTNGSVTANQTLGSWSATSARTKG